MTAFILIFV